MKKLLAHAALAVLATASLPALAVNGSLSFEGNVLASTESTGADYTGSLSIAGTVLTITVDPFGLASGYLTGIAFNGPLGAITGAALAPANFSFVTNEAASPFGTYAYASATNGNWNGGGPPSNGIAIAGTTIGTWTFNLANSSFTVNDFFTSGDDDAPFVVRFRGLPNGGSDKVPATVTAIPEPETYALMLAGLGVLGFVSRRRKQS